MVAHGTEVDQQIAGAIKSLDQATQRDRDNQLTSTEIAGVVMLLRSEACDAPKFSPPALPQVRPTPLISGTTSV